MPMKLTDTPELSETWWNTKAPKNGVEKTTAKFKKALREAGTTMSGLGDSPDEGTLKSASQILGLVQTIADSVIAEAQRSAAKLEKTRKAAKGDKSEDQKDLENTVDVLKKKLGPVLKAELANLSKFDNDEVDDISDSEVATEYLTKILPKVKKRPMNFAFAMASGDPEGHRMVFHRSRASEALAKKLRKDIGARKVIWGVAYGRAAAEDEVVDDIDSKTLALELTGKMVAGSAKHARVMFKKLGVQSIKRVKILVDGAEVESDTDGDSDETDVINAEAEIEEPNDPALLQTGWEGLKAKIMPLLNAAIVQYGDDKPALATLKDAILTAERDGKFDVAIRLTRDKAIPVLKTLQRQSGTSEAMQADAAPVVAAVGTPPRVNASLGKVLGKMYPPPNQGFVGKLFSGGFKDAKTPTQFFNGTKVTFPDGAPANAELQREWAMNMAMLQHMGEDIDTTTPAGAAAKAALDARSMGFLLKFANIPNSGDMGWQGNPLDLDEKTGVYHRSGGTPLYDSVRGLTANSIGIDESNLCLCSDPRIMEEVRRDFSTSGELVDFQNFDDVEFQKAITASLAGNKVFVDMTSLMKSKENDGGAVGAAGDVVSGFRDAVWKQVCAKHGLTAATKAEFDLIDPIDAAIKAEIEREAAFTLDKLRDNLKFGGMAQVEEQPGLAVFGFPVDGPVDADSLKLNSTGASDFRALQGHSGFTAGPMQLLDTLTALTPDVATALRELGVTNLPTVKFPEKMRLPKYDTQADFNGTTNVTNFAALNADVKPYLAVTSKTVKKMMDGLYAEGIAGKLAALGLEPLWQMSLNRIEGLMKTAHDARDDMPAYLNAIQLIMEEITTLLTVAKPYDTDAFQATMEDQNDILPGDFDGVSVNYSLKNSASRCFNAVLTACEDVKEGKTGTDVAPELAKRGLNVLVQGDSYYEPSTYVLTGAKDHRAHNFNTDTVGDADLDEEGAQAAREEQFQAQFDDLKDSGGKLEVYLCEFHHNISYDRKEYKPENVGRQVRKLIDGEVVANPFTVAIDTTIAKTDDPMIEGFLDTFRAEIKDGSMNVVIYRSAQKFDQMGADSFNGGVMCVIAKDGPETEVLRNALDKDGEQALDQNVQGLTHLNKHAQDELNEYRGAIMDNTAKMSAPDSTSPAKLPDDMQLTDANAGGRPLRFAVNTDESAPFIDLKFPELTPVPEGADASLDTEAMNANNLYTDLFKLFGQFVADPGTGTKMAGSSRASFGFQHSNVTLIDNVKMRFNPGLDDEARLTEFSKLIQDASDIMQSCMDDCGTDPKISKLSAESAAASGLINMDTVNAHRALKTANAGHDDAAKNLARLNMARAFSTARRGNMAPNPIGGLRMLDAITNPFAADKATEIAQIRMICEISREAIQEMEVTAANHIAQAKVELSKGLPGDATATLAKITNVEITDDNREEITALRLQATTDALKWHDESNAKVTAAESALGEGDHIAVLRNLKAIDNAAFRNLRKNRIKELTDAAMAMATEANEKSILAVEQLDPLEEPYIVLAQIKEIKRSVANVASSRTDTVAGDTKGPLSDEHLAKLQEAAETIEPDEDADDAETPRRKTGDGNDFATIMLGATEEQARRLADLELAATNAAANSEVVSKLRALIHTINRSIDEDKKDDAEKRLAALRSALPRVDPVPADISAVVPALAQRIDAM